MADSRKRQRPVEEDYETITAKNPELADSASPSTKRPKKETNASARRSLFVRSLPAVATSEALTKLFSDSYALKHATVVIDPVTKQSKGYGFVTFADAEDAQRAKDEFHGTKFMGRNMKVEIAEPRSREVGAKGEDGKKKSTLTAEAAVAKKEREEKMAAGKIPPKLIIRNLPWSIKEEEDLATLFRPFGMVKHATLPKRGQTQTGFGFVVMRSRRQAEKALAVINGRLVDGRTVAVDWAVDKSTWTGQKGTAKEPESDSEDEAETKANGEEVAIDKDLEADPDDDDETALKKLMGRLEARGEEQEDTGDEDEGTDEEAEASDEEEEAEGVSFEESDDEDDEDDLDAVQAPVKAPHINDNSTTLFVRNLPFNVTDGSLKEQFDPFGAVRYARVVMDHQSGRTKGTGFVCFFNVEDAENCFRGAPRFQPSGANATKRDDRAAPGVKHSILQDENLDLGGLYTMDGRVLQVSRAVEKERAVKLTEQGSALRNDRDMDKRRLYLLSEGTIASGTPLYNSLAPSEVKMREDSATQRKKLIQNNPTLHLSLTRLSIRNLPRTVGSKELKALAREAVVGFASDVKSGRRTQLSKEEEARGGDEMKEAERQRKAKGKGIVKQSKIVFEGREGAKVSEDSGAGRSRGYGFIEYSSHRWALMGLRWLNGHQVEGSGGKKQRLIVEFAIENAQVVQRRKEHEEKARIRSQEVLAARERGEAPDKEKKVLGKDALMAKTRKGPQKGKGGKPGGPVKAGGAAKADGNRAKDGKSGKDGKGGKVYGRGKDNTKAREARGGENDNKRKREGGDEGRSKAGAEGGEKKFKPGFAEGEEGRLQRRAQIIQKKRMYKRARKGGA